MNNNYFNQQQQMGMRYNNQQQSVSYTQPINAELAKKMMSGGSNAFTTNITEEERNRAICTHKDPTKQNNISLLDNADGTNTCYICGETFNLVEYDRHDVENICANINDVLQTIKTYYFTMPEKVATEFMNIIVLINKIPQLYEIALADFNRIDGVAVHSQQNQNPFMMLNSILAPGANMPNMQAMQNPNMYGNAMPINDPYQQQQQGMYNPQMAPNPFDMYGNPQQQQTFNPYQQQNNNNPTNQQPQQQQPGFDPTMSAGAPQQQQQPCAPAQDPAEMDKKPVVGGVFSK